VTAIEAPPRSGLTADDCFFYHSVDLPISGHHDGTWDLIGRFDDYTGHHEFGGRTVLDIGTATGFLTFEAERRGATVTSFDVESSARWHRVPIPGTYFVEDYAGWREIAERELERIKNSYWLCHEELQSSARCFYGDVYELDGSKFDTVMLGQILIHLPDGLSAVAAAARACDDTLVIVEGNFKNKAPLAVFGGGVDSPGDAWYHYSHGWYRHVLKILGFRKVEITTGTFKCSAPTHPQAIKLATVVGTR